MPPCAISCRRRSSKLPSRICARSARRSRAARRSARPATSSRRGSKPTATSRPCTPSRATSRYPRSAKLAIHAGGKTVDDSGGRRRVRPLDRAGRHHRGRRFRRAGQRRRLCRQGCRRQDRAGEQAALAEQRGRGGGAWRARHDLHVGRQAAPQDDHHAGVGHAGVRPDQEHSARPRGVDRQDRRRSGRSRC